MKNLSRVPGGVAVFLLALGACRPQSQPPLPPVSPSATAQSAPSPAAATPSLQPASVSDVQAGTVMQWMDGSQLVFVPAGDFVMGADGPDNPKHAVSLSDYWIQRTEVTNRQYALCVRLGQCDPPLDAQAALDLNDASLTDHPVVGVDWQQAQTYCGWIKGSLPTEPQWEKAARGPDGNTYPWGEAAPTSKLLNFNNELGATSDVADYYPGGKSPYGALDMAGNVYEWAGDYYQSDYYPSSPPTDPPGPSSGDLRSVRSSSFSSGADQVPVATRFHAAPDEHRQDLGFRCVVKDPPRFAPYCQTTGYLTGGPPPNSCSPSVRTSYECNRDTHPHIGMGSAVFSGGVATSATVLSPTDGSVMCGVGRGGGVYCVGPSGGASAQVQVRVTCGASADSGGGLTLDVACPPHSHHPADNPDACVPDAPSGEGTLAPDCPPGWSLEGRYCVEGGPAPAGGDSGDGVLVIPCPPGSYRVGARCVTGSVPPATGSECLSGFAFDSPNGCCHAPDPGSYPGCGPGEGLRLISPVEGDVPPPPSCAPASGGSEGLLTVSITTGACETRTVGGPSCSSITSDSVCNSTPGCSFNYVTKTCN